MGGDGGARGLFHTHSGGNQGRAFAARRKTPAQRGYPSNTRVKGSPRLDRFAELLSQHDLAVGDEGGDAVRCARRMGLSASSGHAMLRRLKLRLGWQAQ